MKKKILKDLLLVVVMAVLCLAVGMTASALEPTGQCGDNVYWTFDEATGELVISGEGQMWDDYLSFENSYYSYLSDINKKVSVIIEDGVTSVGSYAFMYTYIEHVLLPDSIKLIGRKAFFGCQLLKEINIPDGVTLMQGCLSGLLSLKSITLPSNVYFETDDQSESYEFIECYGLDDIYILDDDVDFSKLLLGYCDAFIDESKILRDEWINRYIYSLELSETDFNKASEIENELMFMLISLSDDGGWFPNPYTTIHAHKGSTAEAYAKEVGFKFEAIKDEPEIPNEPTPDEPTPDEPEVPDTPSDPTDDCSCNCHKGGIEGFFFKIINFFEKLFNKNKVCICGVKH
jgi:hypothetical protein